jgi:glycine oxidase
MRNQGNNGQFRTADVIIIGGGVIGLSVARSLARRGVGRVLVIERGLPGAEASSAAGGMLAPQAEADRADEFFRLACASRDLYPSFTASLLEETAIDIELEKTGTLYVAFTEHDQKEIEHRFEWQTGAGLAVERLSGDQARLREPALSPDTVGALLFPHDTQVNNRRLVAALSNSVESYGVTLITETSVDRLILHNDRVEGVKVSGDEIYAPVVVVASGAWTNSLTNADKHLPQICIEPVRGQMLCFESTPRITSHVIYSPRGYLVPRLDGRLLAGSTTEHAGFDKRVTQEGVDTITTNAIEISPAVASLPLVDSWAGLRPRADDDLPVLGGVGEIEGLYFATGHYRNGILLAPLTGELLADEITTRTAPPMLHAFSPDRFHTAEIA